MQRRYYLTYQLIILLILLNTQMDANAQQIHVEGKPVQNSILIEDTGLNGIFIDSTGRHGVHIEKTGLNGIFINQSNASGISIANPGVDGISIGAATQHGISIFDSQENGISISGGIAGLAIENTLSHGIFVNNAGNHGMFVYSPEENGIYIGNAGNNGYSALFPDNRGIYVQGAGTHGGEFRDCTDFGVFVVNAGSVGVKVYNTGQDGFQVYGAGRHSATFHNKPASDFPAVTIDHGSSDKIDLQFADDAIIKSVEDYDIRGQKFNFSVDDEDSEPNASFQVLRSAAQGGNYSFITYESGNSYFRNNVSITGSISKGSGTFKIDHPVDPENKFLYHSFVESPDMMNVYNGNITLDENGRATVVLPAYFEALNRDFRYQLTSIGSPGPNLYIEEEVKNLTFVIAGGAPGSKVSWQITGIRQDPYANANRVQVEVEKNAKEKGTYLHPDAYQTKASSSSLPALDETNRELQK